MGQLLHGSARTTEATRRAIQARQESVRALATRRGISPTTVQKGKKRSRVRDAPMGPKVARSSVLSAEGEAGIVAFRRHTLLPLDGGLRALQPSIPHLTRSSLHRCLQRHGLSRLPDMAGAKPKRSKLKSDPIGFFPIDIAEVRTEEGELFLFGAVDRTSKLAFARLEEAADRVTACAFLRALIEAVPYKIHTVLTDNGIQFGHPPRCRDGPTATWMGHLFARICAERGIEHRLTRPNHPWTTDEVERPFSDGPVLCSACPWATAWRRAGREVRARPRSHHRRSSSAAPVGALGPRRLHPSVCLRWAVSACSARRFSAKRVRARL